MQKVGRVEHNVPKRFIWVWHVAEVHQEIRLDAQNTLARGIAFGVVGEWERTIGLWFDKDSQQYLPNPGQQPMEMSVPGGTNY